MKITNLVNTPLQTIVDCLVQSFEGYFVQLPSNANYWEERFRSARVDLGFSYGMFDRDKLVGFIINGIDESNGQLTAFNTGTGVLPLYRGKNIVDSLYEVAIPLLREHGVTRCRLEVIEDNNRGIRVYERIGFEIIRKLYCYKGEINDTPEMPGFPKRTEERILKDYMDEGLYSWDHNREAILASGSYETFVLYNEHEQEVGYFTINPAGGYLARIEKSPRGNYEELISSVKHITKEIKINNVCESRTELRSHLVQAGLGNFINQFEMEMKI